MTSKAPPSILFVCLGHICRSPLAEAALRSAADAAGITMHVDSAGTGNWHVGDPSDRRARQVEEEDFRRFDRIFALDRSNLAALRAIAPGDGTADLGLLMDIVPGREGEDVHDPYYGQESGFEGTWEDVSAAATALVKSYR